MLGTSERHFTTEDAKDAKKRQEFFLFPIFNFPFLSSGAVQAPALCI